MERHLSWFPAPVRRESAFNLIKLFLVHSCLSVGRVERQQGEAEWGGMTSTNVALPLLRWGKQLSPSFCQPPRRLLSNLANFYCHIHKKRLQENYRKLSSTIKGRKNSVSSSLSTHKKGFHTDVIANLIKHPLPLLKTDLLWIIEKSWEMSIDLSKRWQMWFPRSFE